MAATGAVTWREKLRSDHGHRWLQALLVPAAAGVVIPLAFGHTPELFPGAHQVGVGSLAVGASYLAAWPIYNRSVYRPARKARRAATRQIAADANSLAGTAVGLRNNLQQSAGVAPQSLNPAALEALLAGLRFGDPAQIIIALPKVLGTVLDLFWDAATRVERFSGRVLALQPALDPELVRLVVAVRQAKLFDHLNAMHAAGGLNRTTVSIVRDQILTYFRSADELRMWLVTNASDELTANGLDVAAVRAAPALEA